MYLNDLNEAQKALTLDLLLHAMPEERRKSPEGRSRILRYCGEMGISPRFAPLLDENVALQQLTEISSTVTMRKVFVEMAMLAISDTDYEKLGREFTDRYAALTGFRQGGFDEVVHLIEEITCACQRLDELVSRPGRAQ
ncbi:MAG: hypothetical protein IK082_12450 [Oscillospiraceae bacterium]|nr:hypothetical protein [Oscillospiraceae bacterium]